MWPVFETPALKLQHYFKNFGYSATFSVLSDSKSLEYTQQSRGEPRVELFEGRDKITGLSAFVYKDLCGRKVLAKYFIDECKSVNWRSRF